MVVHSRLRRLRASRINLLCHKGEKRELLVPLFVLWDRESQCRLMLLLQDCKYYQRNYVEVGRLNRRGVQQVNSRQRNLRQQRMAKLSMPKLETLLSLIERKTSIRKSSTHRDAQPR